MNERSFICQLFSIAFARHLAFLSEAAGIEVGC